MASLERGNLVVFCNHLQSSEICSDKGALGGGGLWLEGTTVAVRFIGRENH